MPLRGGNTTSSSPGSSSSSESPLVGAISRSKLMDSLDSEPVCLHTALQVRCLSPSVHSIFFNFQGVRVSIHADWMVCCGFGDFPCIICSELLDSAMRLVRYPFLNSLADLGALPNKPHKNIARILKDKQFHRPDISVTFQALLESKSRDRGNVIDVGANMGMAMFVAAAMGFRVVAFEPVFENL